jgi:hypothetical protein
MSEFFDWIKRTLNPPGIHKPRLGALFSTIGRTFDRVKIDAERASNARFPYMADVNKLAEHGRALLIPRNDFDTDAEYRERLATGAFYFRNMGERGYIRQQLAARFGDRLALREGLLNVYCKVLDLTDNERAWLLYFLDGMLDPNITLAAAHWIRFSDQGVSPRDILLPITLKRQSADKTGPRYDGSLTYSIGGGMPEEKLGPRGRFVMRVYKHGELVETFEDRNMIMNNAKQALASLIAGDGAGKHIAQIAVGANGTAPTPDDTALKTPFVKNIAQAVYPQSGQVEFSWTLSPTEANGMSIREFGLLCADGTLFARRTRDIPLQKKPDIALDGQWTIVF